MPLSKTEEDPEPRKHLTHLSHSSLKPLCFKIYTKASCSIVSKAFSKSSFKIMHSAPAALHW
jgi:hypothetical protein